MGVKAKILVVDDDQQMLRLLRDVFTQMGAETLCLESSPQAAEVIQRDKFDGVFLDWKMPEMDGIELAARIRTSESNSECPIVMLTGYPEPDAMQASLRVGINFFLPKPVTVQQIRQLLSTVQKLTQPENRSEHRVALRTPVHCSWNEHRVQGQCLNLSATGMLVALDTVPEVGAGARLEFTLPGDSKPVELTVRVARVTVFAGSAHPVSNRQVGFRFAGISREIRHRLREYIDSAVTSSLS